jgi:hypothetical protein
MTMSISGILQPYFVVSTVMHVRNLLRTIPAASVHMSIRMTPRLNRSMTFVWYSDENTALYDTFLS